MNQPWVYTAGFGGLCAVAASIVALVAALITVRQRREADRASQLWDRYVWLIDRGDSISVDLQIALLRQLTRSASALGDDDLVAFTREYTVEVFASLDDDLSRESLPGGHTEADDEEEAPA